MFLIFVSVFWLIVLFLVEKISLVCEFISSFGECVYVCMCTCVYKYIYGEEGKE